MISTALKSAIEAEVAALHASGLEKTEHALATPQGREIVVAEASSGTLLNFCSNDYLGLANRPEVLEAAVHGLMQDGFGMASVRFICGTQNAHKELEIRCARFLGKEEAMLFGSCFDANCAVFEVLLGEGDVILADRLIHASLIDGIRLCKAAYDTYRNADLDHLRSKLEAWRGKARHIAIVTDGVFSMDGILAPIAELGNLAQEYEALLLVDDSHATGVFGPGGRGTPAHFGVTERVDLVTTTLGKALGGASGGLLAGPAEIVRLLRNRARPYLFSNSLPPPVVHGSIKALALCESEEHLRTKLHSNSAALRRGLERAGFTVIPGHTPIVPVIIGDAVLANALAAELLERGIYVVAFSHPVVPLGRARIRVQLSAQHTPADIERAVEAFTAAGRKLGILAK